MENQSAAPSAPPSSRATRSASRLRALVLALGAVTLGATCRDQNPTGPGLPVRASVAVAPVYQTGTSGGPRLRLARIRARLVEVPAGPDTLTQVVDFTGDSAVAEFDVTLSGGGTRLYRVLVDGIYPTGDTLFRGTDTVRAIPGANVRPLALHLQYTGPDAGLTAIDVLPRDTTLASADSLRLHVAPGEGQTASRIFAGWTSRDATVLTISDSGMIHMRSIERDVWVVAQLWTGVKDSALVHVRAPVFGLTLSRDTGSVVRGDTLRLTATARDSIGTVLTGRTIVWSALDTTVLVDSTGLVRGRTARATGRVVATVGTRSDTARISVLPRPTAALSITPRSVSLLIGDSATIAASAVDAQDQPNPDFPPIFASRNTSVVTVSATGVVRAVGAGTTWLVATSGSATDSVPASVASGVDLVVRAITTPDTTERGVAPTVRVSVGNIGTSTSAPFTVLIALRDSTTGAIVTTTAAAMESGIAPGDSGIVAPTVGIPDTANPLHRWEIVVVADCEGGTDRNAAILACLANPGPGGSIPEANEANNSARRPIAIRAPELSIANAGATGAFTAGGSVLVKYDLVNSAGYAGVPVDVVVGLRDVVQNTIVSAASRRYGAPASNTTIPGDTMRLALPANLVVGNGHEIIVWVDCHDAGDPVAALTACLANPAQPGDVPEIDEANNRVAFPYPPNAGITSTALSIHLDTLVSLGDSVQLTAQAYQSTTPVAGTFAWASRNTGVATVTSSGRVAAVGNGSTWVVATEQGGTRDSAQIVVQQRISTVSITPPTVSRYLGKTQQFAASAVDARGNPVTFATFSWSSSAPATVSVDSTGLASMIGLGTAIVRATAGGITGQADVTVLSPIKRIVVAPDSVTLVSFGTSQGYTATAYDTLDVAMTGISFSWASTNPGVANLSATTGTATSATALANGSTRIRATAQGVTGEALLTVRQVIAGAVVTPSSAIVAPSGRVVFAAYGVDANGYRLTNNPAFSWTSDRTDIATVDANGVVTGVAQGQVPAVIKATSGQYFATASVTVQTSGVPPVITFGRDTLKIGRGTSNSIPLYLSVPSGNGVTINLAAKDTFAYFTQSSVTIPAGQTTINVTLNGRNAGTTQLYATDPNFATGAGYGGDTAVVAVQANVSFSTTSTSLVATDQRSLSVILSDPAPAGGIYVAFGYGTAGVAEVSPDPVYISPGLLSAPVVVKGLAPGSTVISLSAPGVTGANTLTANVSAATLAWYYGNMMLGAGQMQANANYVYIPQALTYPLTITLSSSDSTLARTQPQVVIPTGQTGVYVDARAFDDARRGAVTVTASVPGWTPATRTLTVTTPHVRLCCNQNLNTTSAPAAIYAYAQDSVGSNHDRINSLRVSLVSRDTSVVTVDTATTIGAGANRSGAIYVTPKSGGTTWVVASAGNHTGDSVQVTVAAPNLGIYYGATTLGAGQYEPSANYVYIPNAISTPVTVTFTSTDTTVAKAIGPVIIAAGQTGVYFRIEGYKPGSVTYTARATGYNAASQTARVTSPKLVGCCDNTYPMYQTPVGLTVYARDSLNSGHPVLTAVPVSIVVPTAADSSVIAVDSSSVVIAAGQNYNNTPHVSFRNPGTGRVIVSAAGWGTDTIVYRVDSAAINIYYGIGVSGAGQMMTNGNYVYVPNARGDTVRIAVRNHNARIGLFPDTIKIAPTSNGTYFSWEGLAPGADTIDFSAPGYVGTTRVFPFSRRLLRGSDLPGTLASTAPPFTLHAWTVDTVGNARPVRDTVAVRMFSSDTTVLRLDSTIVHIVRGQQNSRNNTAHVVGVTPTGKPVYIIYQDSAGIMPPDTSSALTIIGPALHFYYGGPARVGMRQVARNANYIYTDNAVSSPLTVTLTSSATNVLKSTTATIPAGQTGTYFDITGGDSLGLVRLTATAQGYQLANLDVDVGQPQLAVSTNQSVTTTTPAQGVTIWLRDQVGSEHETTDTFTVTLVSTQPGVAALDSATVRFLPGMSRVTTPKLRYLSTGTTQIIVTDPRSAFYHYTPDTIAVTVSQPVVQAYYAPTSLGTGQYTDNYVYIPNALSDTLRVAVKHNASLTTLPDTIKIPGGQTGVYYRAVGLGVTGTDTITFSAPNHAPGTTYLYGGPGRLNLASWPGSLAAGDSVQVRVQTLDPAGNGKNLASARTFTLAPTSNLRFSDASGATITSVTVAADQGQSPAIWVHALSSGTGSVTVSGTGYTSATFSTAVP